MAVKNWRVVKFMQISLLHVLCKFLPYFLCGTMLLCNCFVSSFFDSYSVSKRLQLCASRELENKSHEKLAKFSDKSFNMTNTLTCTARICTIKVHTAHTLHKGGGQKSLPSFQFLALYIYVIVERMLYSWISGESHLAWLHRKNICFRHINL